MKKYILLGGLLLLSLSAWRYGATGRARKGGQIGAESSVSREMAAKTIALAFYTNQELDEMETKLNFSDLSVEDWHILIFKAVWSRAFSQAVRKEPFVRRRI